MICNSNTVKLNLLVTSEEGRYCCEKPVSNAFCALPVTLAFCAVNETQKQALNCEKTEYQRASC